MALICSYLKEATEYEMSRNIPYNSKIQLAQDRAHWSGFANALTKCRVP